MQQRGRRVTSRGGRLRIVFNATMATSLHSPDTVRYLQGREFRLDTPELTSRLPDLSRATYTGDQLTEQLARHLPHLYSERVLNLGETDKIFASTWLSEDMALLGSKSNQLLLINIPTGQIFDIPTLQSGATPVTSNQATGIHCISASPDNRLLATGGSCPNELALYRLPDFSPSLVGQGHDDWLFDVTWLTDDVLVTASRDSSMGLWILDRQTLSSQSQSFIHSPTDSERSYGLLNPLADSVPAVQLAYRFTNTHMDTTHSQYTGDKVRGVTYNRATCVLASLQTSACNASVYFWDTFTFHQIASINMPYCAENVCIEVDCSNNMYAIGSRSHVSFVDGRIANKTVGSIKSKDKECGVRSLQFNSDILTVGTGGGNVFFYDLRNGKYLSAINSSSSNACNDREHLCCLKTSPGWMRRDETYRDFFSGLPDPPNAIYTHCYSPTKSKLLLAGGPLPLGLHGNYCGIWS